MLTPRLRTCSECSDIPTLIEQIDCKLAKLSEVMYNNVIFMFDNPIPAGAIIDLLTYKRILQFKYVNPKYAATFTIEMIASKVNLLKYK